MYIIENIFLISFPTIAIVAVVVLVILLLMVFGFPSRNDDWPKDPPY